MRITIKYTMAFMSAINYFGMIEIGIRQKKKWIDKFRMKTNLFKNYFFE